MSNKVCITGDAHIMRAFLIDLENIGYRLHPSDNDFVKGRVGPMMFIFNDLGYKYPEFGAMNTEPREKTLFYKLPQQWVDALEWAEKQKQPITKIVQVGTPSREIVLSKDGAKLAGTDYTLTRQSILTLSRFFSEIKTLNGIKVYSKTIQIGCAEGTVVTAEEVDDILRKINALN